MVERSTEGRRQKTIVCPTFGTARNVETPGVGTPADTAGTPGTGPQTGSARATTASGSSFKQEP